MKVLNLLSAGEVGGIEQLCSNIAKYANYDNIFCFLFKEGKIYDEMKNKGYNVVSLVECSNKKLSSNRWNELCELTKMSDVIVTHHCTIALHFYYIALSKKFKNKKFVMTIHSCFEKKYNYNYGSWLKNESAKWCIKQSLKKSDKILFVSEAGRESYLNNFKIDKSKTSVVYNGVELIENNIIKHNQKGFTRITYIGRLEKIKGVELLIRAAVELKRNNRHFKIWIIGDGSYKSNLINLSNELNLTNEIEFTGTKRNIGDYLMNTDIFVYPSVCEEVFGISIVEAMSYGIPCIANNVGGIPEIIKDKENGRITKSANAENIFKCISYIINLDTKNLYTMKKKCIETARFFSIQNTVLSLQKELEGVVNNNDK